MYDCLVLGEVALLGEGGRHVVVFAEGLERRDGRLGHGDVVGTHDELEDLEDIGGEQREVLRGLLDERSQDSKGDLDVSVEGVSLVSAPGLGIRASRNPQLKRGKGRWSLPNAQSPYIASRLLLEEAANLLNFRAARRRVEEEVAELARVGLDVDGALGGPGIALQNEDLMLWPASLLNGLHRVAEGLAARAVG